MPHFLGGATAYVHQYKDLVPEGDNGFGGVLKTVFGNPGYTATTILLEQDKVLYLLQIMAPLAFFPWRRPIGLLCSLPGFFFTMLATHYPRADAARVPVHRLLDQLPLPGRGREPALAEPRGGDAPSRRRRPRLAPAGAPGRSRWRRRRW